MLDLYPKDGLKRWYLIFGLTDETFVLVTGKLSSKSCHSKEYYFYLTFLNQCYWVAGCATGAGLQSWFAFDSRGFEFVFVALFLVLLIEQNTELANLRPMLLSFVSAFGIYLLLGDKFLVVALGFCVLLVAADYKWKIVHE